MYTYHNQKIICQICGHVSSSNSGLGSHIKQKHHISTKEYYDKYFKQDNEGTCLICGKETLFLSFTKGYCKCCSGKCKYLNPERNNKIKQTKQERYGDPHYHNVEKMSQTCKNRSSEITTEIYKRVVQNRNQKEINKNISNTWKSKSKDEIINIRNKQKETNKERYNDEFYHNKEQAKQTMLDKYGENNWGNREKYRQTCLERYGVDNFYKTEEFQIISKQTKLEKYGNENYTNSEKRSKTKHITHQKRYESLIKNFIIDFKLPIKIIDLSNFQTWKFKCNNCQKEFEITSQTFFNRWEMFGDDHFCTICYPRLRTGSSIQETELRNYIKSVYNDEVSKKGVKKIIGLHELDIWLPKIRLAFEFNGDFWHSILCRDQNYHYWKTNKCEEKNVELIYIYELDWQNKRQLIQEKIKYLFNPTNFNEKYNIVISNNMLSFIETNTIKNFFDYDKNISIEIDNEIVSMLVYKEFEDFKLIDFISKPEYEMIYDQILFNSLNKDKLIISLQSRDWNLNRYKDHWNKLGFQLDKILDEQIYNDGKHTTYNSGFHKFVYLP